MLPGLEQFNCQQMEVPMDVMQHVVRVESSYNPYAIGVVGGHLVRQPKNLPEALATVRMLEARGYNFSIGLAQVNRFNLGKYGLGSYEEAFRECPNLQAGSRILAECYKRLGGDWGKSFSCYYSGNSVTGYRHGYVQKVFASMRQQDSASSVELPIAAIEVIGKPGRQAVAGARVPVNLHSSTSMLQRRIEPEVLMAESPSDQAAKLANQKPISTIVTNSQIVTPLASSATSFPVSPKPVEKNHPQDMPHRDDAFVF